MPVGLILAIFGRLKLLYATALLIALPGVVILNAGITTIKGHQFFGVLLISTCISHLLLRKKGVSIKLRWGYILPLLFLMYIFFSWTRTIALSEDVLVFGETVGTWRYRVVNPTTLEFGLFNITQSLFPIYGVALYYSVAYILQNSTYIMKALRFFIYGSLIVAVSQISFGILYTLRLDSIVESIYAIFGITGYTSPPTSEVGRMILVDSLAGEPGTAALMYLSSLSCLMLSSLSIGAENSDFLEYVIIVILFVALVFTGSTLAYVGIFVIVMIVLFVNAKYISKTNSSSFISLSKTVFFAGVLLGALLLVFSFVQVDRLTVAAHVAKITGGSGEIGVRWKALSHSIEHIYTHYPLFGVGYGSHISPVMADALMVNTGIVGVSLFITFVVYVVKNAIMLSQISLKCRRLFLAIACVNIVYFTCVMIGMGASGMALSSTWFLPALAAALKG